MDLPKTKKELYDTYYLKEDLMRMCKKYDLPIIGSKQNLLQYIADFIENKPISPQKTKKNATKDFVPSLNKTIDKNYRNNEIHRQFFKETINDKFKFNVPFCQWLEENKGKRTYKDAIEIYNRILADKKLGKKYEIGKQFQYNQYTRDFFENNPKLSRQDCLKCWNFKKTQMGNQKYEKKDLKILKKET
jgi:hypothetical protein